MLKKLFKKYKDTISESKEPQYPIGAPTSIRRLHIGGKEPHPDWEILNVNDGPHVDHVMDTRNLPEFKDETFSEIYASHVLEHFDYQEELPSVLTEWYRILKPGGKLYISVPDMDKLCHWFIDNSLSTQERYEIMRMIFGGHIDKYDYHMVGLNQEFLESYLGVTGFINFKKIESFNIFKDTSTLGFKETPISINILSEKPSSIDEIKTALTNNLELGIACHQRGELERAEQIYRKILEFNPEHPSALHLLGVIASQAGQYEEGIELIKLAIENNPDIPDYYNNLGTALYHHGNYKESINACEQALKLNPELIDAHYNLGNALFQLNSYEAALLSYQKTINLNPEQDNALFNMGNVYRALGRFDEATATFKKTVLLRPDHAEAHNSLGMVLKANGQLNEAIAAFEQAILINPDFADPYNNLGDVMHQQGELRKSITLFEKAIYIEPDFIEANFNLGNTFIASGNFESAISALEKTLQLKPDDAELHLILADVFIRSKNLKRAVKSIEKAISLNPVFFEAYKIYGFILKELWELEKAITAYNNALKILPDDAESYNELGLIYHLAGDPKNGEPHIRKAIELQPNYTEAHNNLGIILQAKGDFKGAKIAFEKTLALSPDFPGGIAGIANTKKFTIEDNDFINKAEHVLDKLEDTDANINLMHFALGKMFDDCGEYDNAFNHYKFANIKNRKPYPYDPDEQGKKIATLKSIFNEQLFKQLQTPKFESNLPIFIVGMPRSGTSLVEQIIASHPNVYGAGELTQLGKIIKKLPELLGTNINYPECINLLDHETIRTLSENYVSELRSYSTRSLRITDKMPANFLYIGVIALLFPNAYIIHCRRDPIDTCLSIYFNNLAGPTQYSFGLTDIGHKYIEYEQIMTHWHKVLPLSIMDVEYNDLIINQEEISKKMIAFLDLEWNENCLSFHKSNREVLTASNWQVRQPIYRTSLNRWKNYKKYLGPLKEILAYDE